MTRARRSTSDDQPVGGERSRGSSIATLAGLGLLCFYSIAPVWWLVVSSTKSESDLYNSNPLWFADMRFFENVKQVFTYDDGIFFTWILNSLLYAGVGSFVGMLIAVAAGYGLSRFEFRGRKLAFALIIVSFLVPYALLTLPLYLLFSEIGIVNTAWAVLIPTFINPFSVYLAKVYVDGAVPQELLDAARVDGAGELRIFFQMVMRLTTTGAATIYLLAFTATWNGFFLPLTMLRGEDKWTATLGLYFWAGKKFESGVDVTSLVITGSLLAVIPLVVFMTAMARYWRSGMTLGSFR